MIEKIFITNITWNLSWPIGGFAKGIPRNDLYSVPFLDLSNFPRTFPCLVVTIKELYPYVHETVHKINTNQQKHFILTKNSNEKYKMPEWQKYSLSKTL